MCKRSIYKLQFLVLPVACCLFIFSCKQIDVFEKNTVIPNYEWNSSFTVSGNFIIKDTVSTYSIYLVFRHTDAYQYNNIWLNIGLQPPGDSLYMQKIDLKLGDDATGWEGTGMNDIWEVRKLLNGEPKRFKKAGNYNYSISHIMRDNPL